MTLYKYPFFMKLIYRFGNIPLTLILAVYLVESVIQSAIHWYALIFVIINSAIIISLNKYYVKMYRYFPFCVYADNERMVCKNFLFSKKELEIKHSEIKNIEGGIFNGMPSRPIYIYGSDGKLLIGFYSRSGQFSKLLSTILKNVREELYQDILGKINRYKK